MALMLLLLYFLFGEFFFLSFVAFRLINRSPLFDIRALSVRMTPQSGIFLAHFHRFINLYRSCAESEIRVCDRMRFSLCRRHTFLLAVRTVSFVDTSVPQQQLF